MKPYGHPKLFTCCKLCVKRAGITKEHRHSRPEKRRERQAGKREIKDQQGES